MLLSISITSGAIIGVTRALSGRYLSPRVSTKRIHPKTLRGGQLALRNGIIVAPGGTGNTQVCGKVAWLRMKFSSILLSQK